IECSVMSMEELGPSFDLHAGGEDLIFPHHENEIAQSEALSGQQFARYWFHARFLLVEGQKMSKSLGNFFTVRDLILRGHKPSSIRWLLTQVPYRNQLNFTFEGLKAAASSVEKLRNFRFRLENTARELAKGTDGKRTTSVVPSGSATDAASVAEGQRPLPSLSALAHETAARIAAALNDDLNTAEAQGAVFDMLRKGNTALDAADPGQNKISHDDVQALLTTLNQFDAIFAVLKDDDQPKMRAILDWAKAEGRENEISPELQEIAGSAQLADEQVNQKLAEMEAARKARNFKASDALRAELTAAGIIVENTKEGVRWRRK
ncbi:MAG: DALR domain-containing protein, partial [Terriglobales bacterium]